MAKAHMMFLPVSRSSDRIELLQPTTNVLYHAHRQHNQRSMAFVYAVNQSLMSATPAHAHFCSCVPLQATCTNTTNIGNSLNWALKPDICCMKCAASVQSTALDDPTTTCVLWFLEEKLLQWQWQWQQIAGGPPWCVAEGSAALVILALF
jgi:hypothetical protein